MVSILISAAGDKDPNCAFTETVANRRKKRKYFFVTGFLFQIENSKFKVEGLWYGV
jgi:hypothetical protein